MASTTPLFAWLSAFALTQAVEVPIYCAFIGPRSRAGAPRGWPARIALAFGASTLTHPFVWFAFPRVIAAYGAYFAVSEAFAIAVEAIYAWLVGARRPFVAAFVANGASAALGVSSHALFGWP